MNDALFGALIGGGTACLTSYFTIRHESRQSRQAILQSRFADAYVTLQIYISSWADHAQWNLNFLRFIGETEPQLPQVSASEGARVSLFASEEVVSRMNTFSKAVSRYRLAVGELEDVRKEQGLTGPESPRLKPALAELKASAQHLVGSAEEVHQALRDDLTSAARRTNWFWPLRKERSKKT